MADNTNVRAGAQPNQDQITERARALWAERGRPEGRDLENWLDAERILREEYARRTGGKGGQTDKRRDLDESERRLDGLVENQPSPARRTPAGEQL